MSSVVKGTVMVTVSNLTKRRKEMKFTFGFIVLIFLLGAAFLVGDVVREKVLDVSWECNDYDSPMSERLFLPADTIDRRLYLYRVNAMNTAHVDGISVTDQCIIEEYIYEPTITIEWPKTFNEITNGMNEERQSTNSTAMGYIYNDTNFVDSLVRQSAAGLLRVFNDRTVIAYIKVQIYNIASQKAAA